eukprot:c16105_g1_i1.p1 GENE.c16105_g1_i1~~c16105_g1_i1.p1  ORF type:complete len:756 (+),score=190.45 c16105_g1_i1:33-2270(+)
MTWAMVLLFGVCGAAGPARPATHPIWGIAKQDYERYTLALSSGVWSCGGRSIPASQINDDYCDCEDGSDEPGTSACDGVFYCHNFGFVSKSIFSSHVNDGICDCCDGSDEWLGRGGGGGGCSNDCDAKGAQYRIELSTKISDLNKALREKERLVSAAAKLRQKKQTELENLQTELDTINREIESNKELKKVQEQIEAQEAERLKKLWEQQEDLLLEQLDQEDAIESSSEQEVESSTNETTTNEIVNGHGDQSNEIQFAAVDVTGKSIEQSSVLDSTLANIPEIEIDPNAAQQQQQQEQQEQESSTTAAGSSSRTVASGDGDDSENVLDHSSEGASNEESLEGFDMNDFPNGEPTGNCEGWIPDAPETDRKSPTPCDRWIPTKSGSGKCICGGGVKVSTGATHKPFTCQSLCLTASRTSTEKDNNNNKDSDEPLRQVPGVENPESETNSVITDDKHENIPEESKADSSVVNTGDASEQQFTAEQVQEYASTWVNGDAPHAAIQAQEIALQSSEESGDTNSHTRSRKRSKRLKGESEAGIRHRKLLQQCRRERDSYASIVLGAWRGVRVWLGYDDECPETLNRGEKYTNPDAESARQAIRQGESKKSEIQRNINDLQTLLSQPYGDADSFFPLRDSCAKSSGGRFSYEVCLYGDAKQSDKGSSTKLGSFESLEQSDNKFVMKFSNGQRCWNGPVRSAMVEFSCGSQFEIVSAEESQMCVYSLKARIPAVCTTDELSQVQSILESLGT